jgi:hypothetical protein
VLHVLALKVLALKVHWLVATDVALSLCTELPVGILNPR